MFWPAAMQALLKTVYDQTWLTVNLTVPVPEDTSQVYPRVSSVIDTLGFCLRCTLTPAGMFLFCITPLNDFAVVVFDWHFRALRRIVITRIALTTLLIHVRPILRRLIDNDAMSERNLVHRYFAAALYIVQLVKKRRTRRAQTSVLWKSLHATRRKCSTSTTWASISTSNTTSNTVTNGTTDGHHQHCQQKQNNAKKSHHQQRWTFRIRLRTTSVAWITLNSIT